jgi:hypothetical protein
VKTNLKTEAGTISCWMAIVSKTSGVDRQAFRKCDWKYGNPTIHEKPVQMPLIHSKSLNDYTTVESGSL